MEIYVDGTYQPLARPAIRATDRGLRQGEAVYEGVKLVGRRPLFLEEHLERLAASADALGLPMPWSAETLRPILSRLLGSGGETGMARLYLTAGPPGGTPTTLVWIDPVPDASRPDTPPWRVACHPERVVPYRPDVKHTSRLPNAVARRRARAAGLDDALLVHPDGWVLEGTASNLFFFEADTLHTPARECGILPGITRDVLLEIAPSAGFRTVEGRYPPGIVADSDEVFASFTSAGVKPISELDGQRLPAPVPGPRTRRIQAAYAARVEARLQVTESL
ncbi:MAG TPA: aminotransferase class IV [Gemmatimonadota bacterium]|nr:aminotransferase class IV [Gemmatimonadota bacterium]